MRIGVLGTGMVGRAIAGKLVELGHEVRMGSRTAENEDAERIIDIGDITARGPELYVPLWPRLWGVVGGPHFNIKVVR